MRFFSTAVLTLALAAILLTPAPLFAAPAASSGLWTVCVRADLHFLAADELHGRGSATRDEHLAALYAASLFQSFGLEPAGDWAGNPYIERAPIKPFSEGMQGYMKKNGFDRN